MHEEGRKVHADGKEAITIFAGNVSAVPNSEKGEYITKSEHHLKGPVTGPIAITTRVVIPVPSRARIHTTKKCRKKKGDTLENFEEA